MRQDPLRAKSRRTIRPVVERVEARVLLATFVVTNTNDDSNTGSLRWAIGQSNQTTGPNIIDFKIAQSGVQTIAITSALPTVTMPVTIDGTTEGGYTSTPLVELNGAGAGANVDGLDISAGMTTVKGLSINRFAGSGMLLTTAGNDVISNDFLGTDPTGTIAEGNGFAGVLTDANCNSDMFLDNLMSGNITDGIDVAGAASGSTASPASRILIAGNLFGTDVTGTKVLSSGSNGYGVGIGNVSSITIGGTTEGARNIISGNHGTGILLGGQSSGVLIEGNYIGTDSTGSVGLGNAGGSSGNLGISNTFGAQISGVTIGGTATGAGNVFSGNDDQLNLGFAVTFTNTLIEGNYIGTDASGTKALGGGSNGISLGGMTGVTIGGTSAAARNVISGNLDGIRAVTTTGVLIQGNYIGTDVTGTVTLGNSDLGIDVELFNSSIGGTAAGAGNLISGNAGGGILSMGGSGTLIEGNLIGTDINGTLALGNGNTGIVVENTPGATIGGLAAGAGNIIANNGISNPSSNASGVAVVGVGNLAVSILSNSIYNNQSLGIDVSGETVTDFPPPTITSAISTTSGSTISGTLNALSGSPFSGTYTLQFFSTPTANPSGNVEGKILLGTSTVTLAGTTGSFTETFPAIFVNGSLITATLTDPSGNTSEFSLPAIGLVEPVTPTFTGVGSSSSIPVGQQVTDTFTITNPDPAISDGGLVFTDAIPAGVTFISGTTSNGLTVTFSGGVAVVAIGGLAPGQSVTVTIDLSPNLAALPSFTNTAELTASVPPISGGQLDAAVTTQVTPSADLDVFVSGPDTALVGQPFTYVITASNPGPSEATGITLSDTLPGNVVYVSSSSSTGQVAIVSNGTVTEMLQSLAAGSTEVLTITVIPTAAAAPMISDVAQIMGSEFDPNLANNTFTLATPVIPDADLAILSAAVTPSPVAVGDLVTYTFTLGNGGPSVATGVTVVDALPAGLTFVSGSAAGGTVVSNGGALYAPVGDLASGETSVVTIVALTTMAGTIINQPVVTSPVADPNEANNTATVTLVATPVADVSVTLSGNTGSASAGVIITYTAVVTNNGPSTATNVLLADPLVAGAVFLSLDSGLLVGSVVDGVAELPLGSLASGASATVFLMIIPTEPGQVTNTAYVAASEPDPNLANNASSVSTFLIRPQSFIDFALTAYATQENAGYAAITLVRSGYELDDVTVHFSTIVGGDATPGVDYVPVSQIVDFPAGATTETVFVPVLDNPYDNQNEVVYLQIDSPTGSGTLLPDPTISTLTIIDIDPDLVGPTITAVKLAGYVSSITSIELDTTGHLNPTTATNVGNYSLTALGGGGKGGLPLGAIVPVSNAIYDPVSGSVTLIPSRPLPGDELFLIMINGANPGAVSDLAGNPLNSVYGVTPGKNYNLTFARGTDIVYHDENDDPVTLKLSGPGTIDIDRYVTGMVPVLQVVGGVAGQTVITGTVHPTTRKSTIGSFLGLGQFGSIRVKMTTPPFYVTNTVYPNLQTQVGPPAIDTLYPNPPKPTKPVKTKSKVVKAKSIEVAKKPPKVKAASHVAVAHKPAASHHR